MFELLIFLFCEHCVNTNAFLRIAVMVKKLYDFSGIFRK